MQNQFSDIKEYWSNKLIPVPASTLERCQNIPLPTHEFLTHVGLPKDDILYQETFIQFKPENVKEHIIDGEAYLMIGQFLYPKLPFATLICIKQDSGSVYYDNHPRADYMVKTFGSYSGFRLLYMNQNIQALLRYLMIYLQIMVPIGKMEREFLEQTHKQRISKEEARIITKNNFDKAAMGIRELEDSFQMADVSALTLQESTYTYWLQRLGEIKEQFGYQNPLLNNEG